MMIRVPYGTRFCFFFAIRLGSLLKFIDIYGTSDLSFLQLHRESVSGWAGFS